MSWLSPTSLCLLLSTFVFATNGQIFTITQDPSHEAKMQLIDDITGAVLITSPLSFAFPWPLIQSTWDPITETYYIVSYPGQDAMLYTLNGSLALLNSFAVEKLAFFDLQYSIQQDTLYGIAVSSRYGRDLSNFTLTSSSISAEKLFTLPFMWYINASTFDLEGNTYYALVNNFPNQPNSTDAQKFLIGTMTPPFQGTLIDFDPTVAGYKFQFVSWCRYSQTLYGIAATMPGTGVPQAVLAMMLGPGSPVTLFTIDITDFQSLGPLSVDDDGYLFYFIHQAGCWRLFQYDPDFGENFQITDYCDSPNRFVAAYFAG